MTDQADTRPVGPPVTATPPAGRRGRLLVASPQFRWFFCARLLSLFGDHMYAVGLVFAVLAVSPTPGALGLVLMAELLPKIVITPFAGVWADRLNRRLVLGVGDVVAALVTLVTAVTLASGVATLPLLVALAALLGAATSFFDPAAVGLIAEVVDRPQRQQANASLGVVASIARIGGPALAGLLVAALQPAVVIALNSVSFLLSAGFVFLIRASGRRTTGAAAAPVLRAMWEGWREYARLTWLWQLTIQSAALLFCGLAVFNVIGPVTAHDRLGGAAAWGLIQAGLGVGYLIGRLISVRYVPSRPALTACLLLALTTPSAVSLAFGHSALPVAVTQVLAGIALAINATQWGTLVTQRVPEDRISRIVATDQVATLTMMPLAYALAGAVAPAIGFQTTLIGGAVLLLAVTAAVAASPAIRGIRQDSDRPPALSGATDGG